MGIDNIKPNQFSSIQQLTNQYLNQQPVRSDRKEINGSSFEEILNSKNNKTELHFSKHADNRLTERNIFLTEGQKKRLEDGTEKARAKGIKESLVMVDELAFIVNVSNSTVVTAMSKEEQNESIFTNIDGAVII